MNWLITNRDVSGSGFGTNFADLTFWTRSDLSTPVDDKTSWKQVSRDDFKSALIASADSFPHPLDTAPEKQKHVTLLIHGYNNAWADSIRLYDRVSRNLFSGDASLGECISFDWPSKGSLLGYLPDRSEARKTAEDLSDVLSELYDWMLVKQADSREDPRTACKAKTSVIAHSMGNYVLECAMNYTWTQKNRPLLVSLLQEVLMVAADVDNDIFKSGEAVEHGDGEGIANLSYRITALYSGRDSVLGASAGLKHFGKRRLGRSGLDRTYPVPDNVWDIDCSTLLNPDLSGMAVHSGYFDENEKKTYDLMRNLLQGIDRSVLIAKGVVPMAAPKTQVAGLSVPTPNPV